MGIVAYDFVEFSLYDEIVNGGMRPFLDQYSSDQNVKKLLGKVKGVKTIKFDSRDKFIDNINNFIDKHCYAKEGDLFEVEISQGEGDGAGTIIATPIEPEGLNDLFDIDIPPPPDKKSEIFLDIITHEYDKIKRRAQKALLSFKNADKITFFANRNVQNAKRIAVDAHRVSKQLKSADHDCFDHPDSYIFYLVKLFLVRSILFYQGIFEPYIKSKILNEEELRVFLFNKKPAHIFFKEVEDHVARRREKELRKSAATPSEGFVDKREIENCFILHGDYWEVKFNGSLFMLRALPRIRYIVHLLNNPNKDFFCDELVTLVKGQETGSFQRDIEAIDSVESDDENSEKQRVQPIDRVENELSGDEFQKIKAIFHDLWKRKNDPCVSDSQRAKAESDWQEASWSLSREYGLVFSESKSGGLVVRRLKRLKKEFERARTNVKKQISNAIGDIKTIKPSLSEYLTNHVQTGMRCVFRPPPGDAGWDVRFDP
jgi:hypothetical protein